MFFEIRFPNSLKILEDNSCIESNDFYIVYACVLQSVLFFMLLFALICGHEPEVLR